MFSLGSFSRLVVSFSCAYVSTCALAHVDRASIVVEVPENAKVYIIDQLMTTPGTVRSYKTPFLGVGKSYLVPIRVDVDTGFRTISAFHNMRVMRGYTYEAKFQLDRPKNRIRVFDGEARIYFYTSEAGIESVRAENLGEEETNDAMKPVISYLNPESLQDLGHVEGRISFTRQESTYTFAIDEDLQVGESKSYRVIFRDGELVLETGTSLLRPLQKSSEALSDDILKSLERFDSLAP